MKQHYDNLGARETFADRYHCCYLVYREHRTDINFAIEREKELKKWRREKKNNLIYAFNPELRFLNKEVEEE